MIRAAAVVTLAALALIVSACGEKEENITSSTTATETTTSVSPKIAPDVAEQRARLAASAALPKSFTVKPADWKVTCAGGESGGQWVCNVTGGPCSGKVVVSPPSGADANQIATNAKGVGCKAD